jgi:hypothetical protein
MRRTAMGAVLTVASLAAALLAGAPPAAHSAAPLPHAQPAAASVVPAGDEVLTATADTSGYHLFAAAPGDGWSWHPLATLQPAGYDGERWIGNHCLTGDGRWIVAVIAPWHANNSTDGFDRGGIAYAVDAHTGAVRALLANASLAYFNPGCGTGATVALTRYDGTDQGRTQIALVDPATGVSRLAAATPGEVTSAVPGLGGVVAARGNALVAFRGTKEQVLAVLPGLAFGVHPNAAGGVDLLSRNADGSAGVWTWQAGRVRRVASGALRRVHLFAGRSGHNLISGVAGGAASGLRRVDDAGEVPEAVSLDGSAALAPTTAQPHAAAGVARSATGVLLHQGALPAARAATTSMPAELGATAAATATDPWQNAPAKYQSPRCAVPRNDLGYQVIQPGTDQIAWAAAQAVKGALSTSRHGAPDGLGSYTPSADFPPPALANNPGATVPVNIVWAVMAQESNWDQASWHVPRGAAGNPLTGDYYGIASDPNGTLDYDVADCGYGLGQLTSLMQLSAPGAAPSLQQKAIAVDYQENIAATVAALGAKWNELNGKGIWINNGDATYIEDWYFAIWAFNSGLQPGAPKYGNTTGCDPGPSCTDVADGDNPGGNWGLGFGNNPANPGYDPQRPPFLRTSYDDARVPSRWPYQEKVFGWMETPLRLGNDVYYPALSQNLHIPDFGTFCVAVVDHCTYSASAKQGTCAYTDYHYWWHQTASYINCTSATVCGTGADTSAFPATEPASPANPAPGVCNLNANVQLPGDMQNLPVADTVVVDDEAVAANRTLRSYSCPSSGLNWHLAGTFTPNFAADPSTGGLIGQIDWHQLSAGFGGHLNFTHTVSGSSADSATWDPGLAAAGYYEVRAFVPAIAAVTTQAHYTINGVIENGYDGASVDRFVNQNQLSDQWADLGFYHLAAGATVTLTAQTADGNGTEDIAFDAVAFIHITPGSYVSLGDSYSSGEGMGIPPFESSTDIPPLGSVSANGDGCHRNLNAYSRQYALNTAAFANRPVVHLACSGADIDDVLGWAAGNNPGTNPDYAGNAFYSEPYQVDQIPPDAKLVTLSIGGNDAGFIDVLTNCVTLDVGGQGFLRCKPAYTAPDGTDKLAQTVANLAPRLKTAYQAVKAAAPNAHIVVVTYPQIFNYDPNASDTTVDCSGVGNADRKWLEGITNQLDDVITQQAHAVGLDVLDERNAYANHRMCDSSPDVSTIDIFWLNGSYHPTPAGYLQEAGDLKSHLAAESIVY